MWQVMANVTLKHNTLQETQLCTDVTPIGEQRGTSHFKRLVQSGVLSHSPVVYSVVAYIANQKVYFYFFKRPKCYNQEVLSHSFICLLLPYMEGIVLICNIDLYCVTAISNDHR